MLGTDNYLVKNTVILLVVLSVAAGLLFIGFEAEQEGDPPSSFESEDEEVSTESLHSRTDENRTQPGDSVESPDDYEPREAEEPSEETRYVNEYFPGESPEWQPETNYTLKEANSPVVEVTRFPEREPTPEEYDSAWEVYNDSYEAAKEKGGLSSNKRLTTDTGATAETTI